MPARPAPRAGRVAGFSLIELLIVVTVILILAAIAIPKLISVKMVANEAAAVSNLRAIDTAEAAYAASYPGIGFSASLTQLGGTGITPTSTAACLLDESLAQAAPKKQGYSFTYTAATSVPVATYTLNADPVTPNISGVRHFFVDATGVIHYAFGAAAKASDAIVGN